MKSKFKLPEGVFGAEEFSNQLIESYSVKEVRPGLYSIIANVSQERIDELFPELAGLVLQPAFGLFEIGTAMVEANMDGTIDRESGVNIYYMNGVKYDNICEVYSKYRDILAENTEVGFGYAAHNAVIIEGKKLPLRIDEIFFDVYKVLLINTQQPEKYIEFLERKYFIRLDQIKTITNLMGFGMRTTALFNQEVKEMILDLEENGMFLSGQR